MPTNIAADSKSTSLSSAALIGTGGNNNESAARNACLNKPMGNPPSTRASPALRTGASAEMTGYALLDIDYYEQTSRFELRRSLLWLV